MAKSTTVKRGTVHSLDYLAAPEKHRVSKLCAVHGDDAFLKAEVLRVLRRHVLGGGDAKYGLSLFEGHEVSLRDVQDALATKSLFRDGPPVVIVENADAFVSEHRP